MLVTAPQPGPEHPLGFALWLLQGCVGFFLGECSVHLDVWEHGIDLFAALGDSWCSKTYSGFNFSSNLAGICFSRIFAFFSAFFFIL